MKRFSKPLAFTVSAALVVGMVTTASAQKAKSAFLDIAQERAVLEGRRTKPAVVAAGNLGKDGRPEALDALLDALAMGLHPKVAAAVLDAIAAHRNVRAYEAIQFYLHYRDARVRAAAVRAVGSLDDPRTASHVLAALSDSDKAVRQSAIEVVAARKLRRGIEPMLELLKRGDEATAPALASLATPSLAATLGEFIGEAPDFLVARTLGSILKRSDFGPETARVQVVRTLGKVPGAEAVAQLTAYIDSIPEKPPRQSRREAEAIVQARLSEGK